MGRRCAALCALLPLCAARSALLPRLSAGLKSHGDEPVATVACIGEDCIAGAPLLTTVLEATGEVAEVEAPTSLAVLSGGDLAGNTHAVAAADVIVLECRMYDLAADGPHGFNQLRPVLARAVKLLSLRPQKKLLLLTVTDFEPADDFAEEEIATFANEKLADMWKGIQKPDDCPAAEITDLLEVSLSIVRSEADAAAHAKARDALKRRFVSADAPDYLFASGRWTCDASSAAACAERIAKAPPPAPYVHVSPAETAFGCRCMSAAEGAASTFTKGLKELKKKADASLLPDFGERCSELLETALSTYDTETEVLKAAKPGPVAEHRAALVLQLERALGGPYRKQLAALQKGALAKFRSKLGAMKPAVTVEKDLKALLKETKDSFESSAKKLVPAGTPLTWTYERDAVMTSLKEQAPPPACTHPMSAPDEHAC